MSLGKPWKKGSDTVGTEEVRLKVVTVRRGLGWMLITTPRVTVTVPTS